MNGDSHENSFEPSLVIMLSGKRKSGKDYFADLLQNKLTSQNATILKLANPIKHMYAKMHGLDYEEMLKDSSYKETYRKAMIKWGEDQRELKPTVFCEAITKDADKTPVWIISDARRNCDVKYFKTRYPGKTILVRIESNLETRVARGFVFTPGVDDAPSECELDKGIEWDYIVFNKNEKTDNLNDCIDILYKHFKGVSNFKVVLP